LGEPTRQKVDGWDCPDPVIRIDYLATLCM
jgi:hypothetical protein